MISFERQEKVQLREKLSGQAETVHQLSLHVQLLMVRRVPIREIASTCVDARRGKEGRDGIPASLGAGEEETSSRLKTYVVSALMVGA